MFAMSHFPVSSSILSAAHLNRFLRNTYRLSIQSTCELIKAGINHSYLLTDGNKKFVFRVYSLNWRTKNEISEEIRLLSFLSDKGISVSNAVIDKNGRFIQELTAPEGPRSGVLFTWAEGEKSLNFTSETHFRIGEIMAIIHKSTLDYKLNRVDYSPQILLVDSFEMLKQFLSVETEEMHFMNSTQKYVLEELEKTDTSKLRLGAVHLDIWFDNLHIDSKDKITIFDFDFCGNGWLCLDIAYYLLQLFTLEPDEEVHSTKLESFLKGYESIIEISEEEKRVLPVLGICLYFFYLGVQCQRFENYSNVFINETYLKRYITIRIMKYFTYLKQNKLFI